MLYDSDKFIQYLIFIYEVKSMKRYKKFMDDIELSEDAPVWSKRLVKCLSDITMSQAELAYKSGIPPATLNSWIRGAGEPKVSGLNTVAKTLGVSLDYLIGNIEIKSTNINHKEISKRLGLSEKAICILEQATMSNYTCEDIFKSQYKYIIEIINFLLSKPKYYKVLHYIWLYLFADIKLSAFDYGDNDFLPISKNKEVEKKLEHHRIVHIDKENTSYFSDMQKTIRTSYLYDIQENLSFIRNDIAESLIR